MVSVLKFFHSFCSGNLLFQFPHKSVFFPLIWSTVETSTNQHQWFLLYIIRNEAFKETCWMDQLHNHLHLHDLHTSAKARPAL